MRMEEFMKDLGRLIKEMGGDLNYLLMVILIRVNIELVKLMVKALIHG